MDKTYQRCIVNCKAAMNCYFHGGHSKHIIFLKMSVIEVDFSPNAAIHAA